MRQSIAAAFALICAVLSAHAQSLSPEDLGRRTIERRAVEAVIWGMPAEAAVKAGGNYNMQ